MLRGSGKSTIGNLTGKLLSGTRGCLAQELVKTGGVKEIAGGRDILPGRKNMDVGGNWKGQFTAGKSRLLEEKNLGV